jgi:heptosyltransferase-3
MIDLEVVKAISPADARSATRVLIVNVTRIGDTLLATPAIRAIAAFFPNAKIDCLGHPKRVEVLRHLPYVATIGSITKNTAPYRGRLGFLSGLRYDFAFVWGNDWALHQYALRTSRHVVAFRQQDEAVNRRLFADIAEPRPNSRHAVAWHLALPLSVGIPAAGLSLDYVATEQECDQARQRLRADFGSVRTSLVGLQIASFPTKAYRDWPIGHFVKLAQRIIKIRPEARFVLFGSADDRSKTAVFANALPGYTRVYAGEFSLRQTAAMMHALDLYIGVDTGPTHLYGALRKPMVAMYHPSLPSALYRPLEHPALYVVDHPAAGPDASKQLSMAELSVDTVWERAAAALSGESSRFPGMPAVGIDLPYWPGDPV